MPEPVLDAGIALILQIQALGSWLKTPMEFFSFLGTENFYLLIMPALVWCLDYSLGFRVGMILLLSGSLNSELKLLFHDPRPFWVDRRVIGYAYEGSFGLPSGHSQNAVAVWGLLAASIRKGWVWLVALGLMIAIGFSRAYLGVHFPTDILVGWGIGAIILTLFLSLEGRLGRWISQRALWEVVLALFVVVLLLIFSGAWIQIGLVSGGWSLPAAWRENALAVFPDAGTLDPAGISSLITTASSLFGFGVGAAWLSRRGGFDARGAWPKQAARFGLGLAGILVLYVGLGEVFPSGENLVAYLFRFVRYALITAWISGLAPYVFMRLGLARSTA